MTTLYEALGPPIVDVMDAEDATNRIFPLSEGNPGAISILAMLPVRLIEIIEKSDLRGARIYDLWQKGVEGFLIWLVCENLSHQLKPPSTAQITETIQERDTNE